MPARFESFFNSVEHQCEPGRLLQLKIHKIMEIVKLKLADLEANIGQVPALPMNPRQWTKTDVDTLAKSLQETPELFEARPVLVVPNGDKYVILGGNMRFEASKALGLEEVPAIVFPATTPAETLKAIVIKDNGAFGSWDYDALANEWDDLPLTDWGVPAWKEEEKESAPKEDLSDKIDYEFKLEITCESEAEQEKMYNELTERGFSCRILTL